MSKQVSLSGELTGILIDEEIDPVEINQAMRSLRQLISSLKSHTLREDVLMAYNRISRIRCLDAVERSA